MGEEAEKETETRKSGWFWSVLGWVAVIVGIYVLSLGPVMRMVDKKRISGSSIQYLEKIYAPLEWAYDKTALHKPLGMYLHLWSERFDRNGDK